MPLPTARLAGRAATKFHWTLDWKLDTLNCQFNDIWDRSMELLDIVILVLFRGCELAGAAIFALRFRGSISGILGVIGFLGLFLNSIGQLLAISVIEALPEILWVGVAFELLAFCLVLLALWRAPVRTNGRSATSS